jgi:hypothetical protein
MYVPTPSAPPSPQVQDLGQRIATTVKNYLAENPGISSNDVSQAFTVARQLLRSELGGTSQQATMLLIAGLLGVLALGLVVALNFAGGWEPRIPMIGIAIGVIAIGAIAVAISKRGL